MNVREYHEFYRRTLFDDVMVFWNRHGLDGECGGFLDYLDRRGQPLSTDKGGWVQGRVLWLYAHLFNRTGEEKWLENARRIEPFLCGKVLDGDNRAWFELTRSGEPLVRRRYLFTEIFAAMGLAEYARACGDSSFLERARLILERMDSCQTEGLSAPGVSPRVNSDTRRLKEKNSEKWVNVPKINPATRRLKGHAMTMILINLFQVMRDADPGREGYYNGRIDVQIDELKRCFIKPEQKALLEVVNEDGSVAEGSEGRCVNPGHAIETAWFILREGGYRNNESLVSLGCQILDWSLEMGWDGEYGGLFNFVDVDGLCPQQVEWDMKYWWPHCEALIATLMAYELTGRRGYWEWFERVHEYAFGLFPDGECGEWFGYFTRRGELVLDLKGNHFKGPFHLPRALIMVMEGLGRI